MLTSTRTRPGNDALLAAAGLAGFALLGAATMLAPAVVLAALAVIALPLLALWTVRKAALRPWEALTLASLTLYAILNYGFGNLAVRIGPVPVSAGHLLLAAAAVLAAREYGSAEVQKVIRHPGFLCVVLLFALSAVHLFFDVPKYGVYAIRDASFVVEGGALALGLLWGRRQSGHRLWLRWILVLTLLNAAYALTFPAQETLRAASPTVSLFNNVPLVGHYQNTYLYLLSGIVFFALLGRFVVAWPGWLQAAIVLAQLVALALHQARSTYLGLLLCIVALFVFGERRAARRITGAVAVALLVIAVLGSVVTISGRMGPVTTEQLQRQAATLLSSGTQGAQGSDRDRHDWYEQAWSRTTSSTRNFIFGEGFGLPLIDFRYYGGREVRQPHNTSLTVIARLGLVGLLIWLALQVLVLKEFFWVLRRRARLSPLSRATAVFLLLLYGLFMMVTHVQPLLEFSHGAIPYFFCLGFSFTFLRRCRYEISMPELARTHAA